MNRWMMPVLAAGIVAAGASVGTRLEDARPAAKPAAAAPRRPRSRGAAPAGTSDTAAKAPDTEKVSYAIAPIIADNIQEQPQHQ